ncbi:MAG: UDP-N-acetylmuramoyl-tripeptide--D-alanyl-D-alanine ligase [Candidatus Omnitrophica bacterium]|nr:UDP-N-acetylmuramoyl-tripeptide--D-alanyl-D-alanine ligase [Candidatus Omnitrophota bacterium]MDD5770971.1 UDP-N-acetylmuramoyl-tripeptide--D-alanyl-D-alanine ligase [Candidatus Omnitrophota bacterium]
MFTLEEIIRATAGRLIQGELPGRFKGISTDSRTIKPKEAFLALKGDNFDGHDFIPFALRSGAACIIAEDTAGLSFPKNISLVKVADTTLALGNLARFRRERFEGPLVAVTGSNGKTTVKEMIAWILSLKGPLLKNEGTKNNQIGLPQTLIRLNRRHSFAVVEIGTNHFGEVGYLSAIARPNIGVLTNIGPSHLESFGDLGGVMKEKSSLLDNLLPPAIALFNSDDRYLRSLAKKGGRKAHSFSYCVRGKGDFYASSVRLEGGKVKFRLNRRFDFELPTLGTHNVYNALAAIATARILGFGLKDISRRLASFDFPRGRLKLVEIKGVRFIDDTYNSNPLSLGSALNALGALKCKGRKILVMGDMLELGGKKELLHRRFAGSITDICDALIAVGELSALTAASARRAGFDGGKIFCCSSSCQARELLLNKVAPGNKDVILVKGSRSMKMEEVFKI